MFKVGDIIRVKWAPLGHRWYKVRVLKVYEDYLSATSLVITGSGFLDTGNFLLRDLEVVEIEKSSFNFVALEFCIYG